MIHDLRCVPILPNHVIAICTIRSLIPNPLSAFQYCVTFKRLWNEGVYHTLFKKSHCGLVHVYVHIQCTVEKYCDVIICPLCLHSHRCTASFNVLRINSSRKCFGDHHPPPDLYRLLCLGVQVQGTKQRDANRYIITIGSLDPNWDHDAK